MDPGGWRGGSIKVLEYLQDHPQELAYDFRHKFQVSIDDVGGTVSLREAALLISMLLHETDSWFQATLSEWKYPVTREWIVAAHTYDLIATVNSKKTPKPYPTPWLPDNVKRVGGKSKNLSNAEVLRRLDIMNAKENNG